MIFHTAAEKKYYNAFFKMWHRNILKHFPAAKFSLKFVGNTEDTDVIEFCKTNNINLILDPTTWQELLEKHKTEFKASGYYPMARWNSIPVTNEHVCVTDVDVIMLKNEMSLIEELLETRDYIALQRGKKCRLMVNFINKSTCSTVRNLAIKLMDSPNFQWDLDVTIGNWMELNLTNNLFLNTLTKFDSAFDRTAFLKDDEAFFGYYSSVSFTKNGTTYAGGFEAKSAKYKIAQRRGLI